MKGIAAMSLVAGVLAGILVDQAVRQVAEKGASNSVGTLGANPCSPEGLPSADLGKAMVLADKQHTGDPLWVGPMESAAACKPGKGSENNAYCESYFLYRHALGLDLTSGDTRKCIPYEEVYDFCIDGAVPLGTSFCKQALDAKLRRFSP